MPTTIFKSTIFFQIPGHGWTETYWQTLGDVLFSEAMDNLRTLARRRAALLGTEASIQALRVSTEGVQNDSFLQYFILNGVLQQPCADPGVGVLMTMKDATLSRWKNTWLKGFWDSVESNSGVYLRNTPGWRASMDQWLSQFGVTNSLWGWWGVNKAAKVIGTLTGYTQAANNVITFTFANAIFAGLPVQTNVQIRFKGINGRSKLNGVQTVTIQSPTTCTTFLPVAAVPWSFGGVATYQPKTFFLAKYASDQKTSDRHTGAPLLEERGRQKAKPRV